MKEIKKLLKQAYLWGRDNGEGRSDKNFNDFLTKPSVRAALEPTHRTVEEIKKVIAGKCINDRSAEAAARDVYALINPS